MKKTGRESLAKQATSEGDSRQAITGGFYQRNLDGVEVEPKSASDVDEALCQEQQWAFQFQEACHV